MGVKQIQFETVSLCNARCLFCPTYEMQRPKGFMKEELVHKIIKEGKELGITHYAPFLNGEPFLAPKIYDFLDYMEAEGVKVVLFSNGELMDVDRVMKHKNIVRLNISLNAVSKEVYDKEMRGPKYEKVMANAEKLNSMFDKNDRTLTFGFVVTPDNAHEKRIFAKKWGKHANLVALANWGGARPEPKGWEKTRIRRYCYRVFWNITILWDGRMNLCCMDYDGKVIWGDLNKESLRDLEAKKKEIKAKHRAHDYSMSPCNVCNYNTM